MPEQPTAPELSALIGRPPEDVVDYFEEKGYQISFRWRDTWREANAKAFTVAGVTKLNALKAIRGEVEKAISEGTTLREFKQNLEPKLKELGFWGETDVLDEDTGEVRTIDLSQPWRLRTIYQTNLQTSYMAGRWKSHQAAKDRRPYLRYVAVLDASTRPTHRANHGTVAPVDDPFWLTAMPPNGWNCRCRTQSLSERQVQKRGATVRRGDELDAGFVDEEWQYNPGEAAFQPDLDDYPEPMAADYRQDQGRSVPDRLSGVVKDHPRLERLGARLHVQDATTPVVQQHLQDLNLLPDATLERLRQTGVEVHVGDVRAPNLDQLLDLADKHPRGWPKGRTWSDAPGGYFPNRGMSGRGVVAAGRGDHGSSSLLLHESAHALDDFERLSADPAFRDLHEQAFDRLPSYLRQGGPRGVAGAQELWAEGLAIYFKRGPKAAEQAFGAPFVNFLEDQLDLDAPSSAAEPPPDASPR